MMINDDQKYPIGVMQQQPSSSPSSVNQIPSSTLTIYDNNHFQHMTERKSISSSSPSPPTGQINFSLQCLYSFDEKYERQRLFDQIFTCHHSSNKLSEFLFRQYLHQLTTNFIDTFILLVGQYQEISQLQTNLIVLTRTYFNDFLHQHENEFILRITVQEFSSDIKRAKSIVLPSDSSEYLQYLCSIHQSSPLLITFNLLVRSSNSSRVQFHFLSTNDHSCGPTSEEIFSHLLISLSSSSSSSSSRHRSINEQTLTSIFEQYVSNLHQRYFCIFAIVNHEKEYKFLTKIQRLLHTKQHHTIFMADKHEEIWVDGPLSQNEIWIDGPRTSKIRLQKSTPKHHRSRPMHTKSRFPLRLTSPSNFDDSNFDTESVVSSHCHLPVLPVFKDHSLLPFRSNQQTLPRLKQSSPPTKINLKLSTNQLNDDLEFLEKTLETLLVPSPIVPQNPEINQSYHRMEELSSTMSHDEKNKRLSRIVSPTRFEKLFHPTDKSSPSVPNSPFLLPKNRHLRTPNKKPKVPLRTTSLAESTSRPSIFQRLFGLRSSIHSPPLSPLTVTLDSHDDLMPLTTSSTASSGRASSSGYESMSNTVLEDMLSSHRIRKDDRRINNSPLMQHQQRFERLKHRQNELKFELSMMRTLLLKDKNRSDVNKLKSPMHIIRPNIDHDDEDELEKDIEHLERGLALAKSQLFSTNHQTKTKLFKT